MKRRKLDLTMTLSLSLNCQLADKGRSQMFMLPLAWASMELSKWQRLARRLQTAVTIGGILGRSLAWGIGW